MGDIAELTLRRKGGFVTLAIPPRMLEKLGLTVGDSVSVTQDGSRLVLEPSRPHEEPLVVTPELRSLIDEVHERAATAHHTTERAMAPQPVVPPLDEEAIRKRVVAALDDATVERMLDTLSKRYGPTEGCDA